MTGRAAPEERYNDVDMPAELRNKITQLVDDHYKSIPDRKLIPYHVDVIVHMREIDTDAEMPFRIVHMFASKIGKELLLPVFAAAKAAIDVRIKMHKEDLERAAAAS